VHKSVTDRVLNSYLFESTLNFRQRNYAFTRLELVDKDELFPQALMPAVYRIAAYTFGGTRDLIQNRAWQLGLGLTSRCIPSRQRSMRHTGIFRCRFRSFCACVPANLTVPISIDGLKKGVLLSAYSLRIFLLAGFQARIIL
jgi:hypothetical protein